MASMAEDIQHILDLAPAYSREATEPMLQREAAGKDLARGLKAALPTLASAMGLQELHLDAKDGGRQAQFGPLAWVRVFSRDYAPTAQRGIYLVYLFSADGSRVYLSLNQGTSEFRSGHQRTINDTRVLLSRAGQARAELGDLMEAEVAANAAMSMDLGSHVITGHDSRAKARAYEDANILAKEYLSGQIPPDEQLIEDLAGMLPLLARLYGQEFPGALAAESTGSSPTPGAQQTAAGREQDSVVRKLVEVYAEQQADLYLTGLGWTVKHVGPMKLGYDLECENPHGEALHVEVKGTRSRGEKVILTDGEVRHAREAAQCGAAHILYVLSQIIVEREGMQCSGGKPTIIPPVISDDTGGRPTAIAQWVIDDSDLVPTEYTYNVLAASERSAG